MSGVSGHFGAARTAVHLRLTDVSRQSERTLLLGGILLMSAASAATVFILSQYFSIDALSSLVFPPHDCSHLGIQSDRHCFSDYGRAISWGMQPNPWSRPSLHPEDPNPYPAAATVPPILFGLISRWLHVPAVGLFAYLLVLAIAVLSPALWAARGARGLERVVVFVALGAAAIPAWTVIDRASWVGLIAPVGLGFLVAVCRERWALAAVMVTLAALVRPQFAILVVVLFAARQWRMGTIALSGILMSNLAAYLLWPQEFPDTIRLSIHNALNHSVADEVGFWNVSFSKGLLLLPDSIAAIKSGKMPEGVFAGTRSVIGYVVLAVVVVCVLVLGRRIAPVMAGVALLASASLAPALTFHYYLVFALPIAAVVVRDPDGPPESGVFDRVVGTVGDNRRVLGACVSLAVAVSIAQIVLPFGGSILHTTRILVPSLWLVSCAVIVVSYARRPNPPTSRCLPPFAAATGVRPRHKGAMAAPNAW